MRKKTKLVFGVGINDADYVTQASETINGKQKRTWTCPYYTHWRDMLKRCYSVKYHSAKPTYKECIVDSRWLNFTKFSEWMSMQDWEGNHLDKDLLEAGNKVYSPDKCVFISRALNNFIVNEPRGKYPLGASYFKKAGKLIARCSNPFTGKSEHLGLFTDPDDAHRAWKKRKHELALIYADMQTDERIADALRSRYVS